MQQHKGTLSPMCNPSSETCAAHLAGPIGVSTRVMHDSGPGPRLCRMLCQGSTRTPRNGPGADRIPISTRCDRALELPSGAAVPAQDPAPSLSLDGQFSQHIRH